MEKSEKRYEEYAYVLDYLPHGRPGSRPGYRAGALVQVVGEEYFTLLEAIAKEGVVLKTYDRVYVGKDAREKITYIIGRINYDELTSNAKMELPAVVEKMVVNRENWFVIFFNTAQAITPRMHALELIPGITCGRFLMKERKGLSKASTICSNALACLTPPSSSRKGFWRN